jgi:predicted Zn-dependent protease
VRDAVASLAAFCVFLAPALSHAQSLIRDTEVEETLHQLADPVFEVAGLDPKEVEIMIIGDKELNAFATSGQRMGLYTGLIIETETPNQLLGVIAHETCHIACGHTARSGTMMRAGLRPMLLTMGLGLIAAMAGAPDAAMGLLASSGQFGTLAVLTYSRVQEASADQAAAGYLEKVGRSGRGLAEFFENFRYQEVFSQARRYAYFRSHPISSDRISALKGRVEKASNYGRTEDPKEIEAHAVMKAKLDAFLSPPQQSFVKYKEKDTSYPARYARAIAYYRASEPERALKAIDALLAERPDNPYLWELKGQVLFENGRVQEAEAPHRKSVELKPDAPLLRVNLGQAILAVEGGKRTDEGIAELQKALRLEDDNSFAWRLLSQAYDRKGQPGLARLAAAEANFSEGDDRQARVFGMRARDQLERGTPEWRRATDIVLASEPSRDELRSIARDDARPVSR